MSGIDLGDWQGADDAAIRDFVLAEMPGAGADGDWDKQCALLELGLSISDSDVRAETLNKLMIMPGHTLHQAVTREVQLARDESSIPYIRLMLEGKFEFLGYTCSEHKVIAKWFSHALADINTPAALETIVEFSRSEDLGIAAEMMYRLEQLKTRRGI